MSDLQNKILAAFKEELKKNPQWDAAEKKRRLEEIRNREQMAQLPKLRKRLYQKIDEKISISEQLFGMSKQNLRAVTAKKNELERILRATGQLKEPKKRRTVPNRVGRLVAACVTPSKANAAGQDNEELWILCKVKDWSDKGKVVVSDADNPNQKYTLRTSSVVLLAGMLMGSFMLSTFCVTRVLDHDDVASARARLPSKGEQMLKTKLGLC